MKMNRSPTKRKEEGGLQESSLERMEMLTKLIIDMSTQIKREMREIRIKMWN